MNARRALVGLLCVVLVPLAGGIGSPVEASATTDSVEVRLLEIINQGRSGRSLGPLVMHAGLRTEAQSHSAYMASKRSLTHDGFTERIDTATPHPAEANGAPDDGFGAACENVAYYHPGSAGATVEQVAKKFYDLWYDSTGHRNCMFDAWGYGLNVAGTGIYKDSLGYWWATLEEVRDTTPPVSEPTAPPGPVEPFATDFEGDVSSWTRSGLWRLVDDTTCVSPGYASATRAYHFGGSDCDYATGKRVQGTLTSPTITVGAEATLSFSHWRQVEKYTKKARDKSLVQVSYDAGSTWKTVWSRTSKQASTSAWETVSVPLSPTGSSVRVRFLFDSVDRYRNAYRGWLVDDVRVG